MNKLDKLIKYLESNLKWFDGQINNILNQKREMKEILDNLRIDREILEEQISH